MVEFLKYSQQNVIADHHRRHVKAFTLRMTPLGMRIKTLAFLLQQQSAPCLASTTCRFRSPPTSMYPRNTCRPRGRWRAAARSPSAASTATFSKYRPPRTRARSVRVAIFQISPNIQRSSSTLSQCFVTVVVAKSCEGLLGPRLHLFPRDPGQ